MWYTFGSHTTRLLIHLSLPYLGSVGRKYCVATLKREIKEIEEDNVSLEDAEARTDAALKAKDWVKRNVKRYDFDGGVTIK